MAKIAGILKYRCPRRLGNTARLKEDGLPNILMFGTIEGRGTTCSTD